MSPAKPRTEPLNAAKWDRSPNGHIWGRRSRDQAIFVGSTVSERRWALSVMRTDLSKPEGQRRIMPDASDLRFAAEAFGFPYEQAERLTFEENIRRTEAKVPGLPPRRGPMPLGMLLILDLAPDAEEARHG